MSLTIWMHDRIIRRFLEPVYKDGHSFSKFRDITIKADVQTMSKTSSTDTDGDYPLQRLKVYSNDAVQAADEHTGKKADLLWFHGKWFECRAVRLSKNTMLKHYTCEFVQCLTQPEPPDTEGTP